MKYINSTTCYELQRMATYLIACARKYLLDSIPYRGPSLLSLPARIVILTVGILHFARQVWTTDLGLHTQPLALSGPSLE